MSRYHVSDEYDRTRDQWRVSVTVTEPMDTVHFAKGWVAKRAPNLVMVDQSEGHRTPDGIEYVFTFEADVIEGVRVSKIASSQVFWCAAHTHGSAPTRARVRVSAPGKRERVSVTLCGPCWSYAVVKGLKLDQVERHL